MIDLQICYGQFFFHYIFVLFLVMDNCILFKYFLKGETVRKTRIINLRNRLYALGVFNIIKIVTLKTDKVHRKS